jgi:drug/metabolite transporter (DMT)-like permease
MMVLYVTIFFSISSSSILVLLSGASAVACAFWRVFIATIILGLVHLVHNGFRGFPINRKIAIYSIGAGAFLAAHFLLWMESLYQIPVAVSTTIVVTYPLFSIIIDHIVFKEKMKVPQVLGLIVGFLGILFFMHPSITAGDNGLGAALSLGGALCATGYFSMGRAIRKKTNLLTYTISAYVCTSIFLFTYAIISGNNLVDYSPQTFTYFILLAIIPMIGGHTLINYLLKYLKTSVATSIALGEPIGASILAYFIIEQQVDALKAVIMAIVLVSLAYTITQEAKRNQFN